MDHATACPFNAGLDVCIRSRGETLTAEAVSTVDQVTNQYNGSMSLHRACKEGRLEIVKDIVSNGLEDINSRGKYQVTPVMESAFSAHVAVFDYLVSQGCDLTLLYDAGSNILHAACIGGSYEIVRTLIVDKKFDIEKGDSKGRRPVILAVLNGNREVFELFVENNCNLTVLDSYNNSLLHTACSGGNPDKVRKLLLTGKYDIDARGCQGETPVLAAARTGKTAVFKLLEEKGCNLTAVDTTKKNILHLACYGGHVDMVEHILSLAVVSIDSRDKCRTTPVMLATIKGKKDVFDLLVKGAT